MALGALDGRRIRRNGAVARAGLHPRHEDLLRPEGKDVIAYGEVVFTTSVDEWREFTVKLDYTATDVVPTHLMIVCSASRYGDYFTGSSDSVMWVDDFELVYE